MCFQNSLRVPIVNPFPDWKVIKQGANFLNDNYKGKEREKGRNGTGQSMDLHISPSLECKTSSEINKLQEEEKGILT